MFTGTFLISLTIVALTNGTSLNIEENKAYTVLKRIAGREELKSYCSKIILCYLRMLKLKKEMNREELVNNSEYTSLKRLLNDYKLEKNLLLK